MATQFNQPVPTLSDLPASLAREGAIDIEFEQGVLVFRISKDAQGRIEELVQKQASSNLTFSESDELDQYEKIDDYLSYLNRLIRNLAESSSIPGEPSAS
jgi:pantothenate kinase